MMGSKVTMQGWQQGAWVPTIVAYGIHARTRQASPAQAMSPARLKEPRQQCCGISSLPSGAQHLGVYMCVYKTNEKMAGRGSRVCTRQMRRWQVIHTLPHPKLPNPRTHLTWHTALPAASTASLPAPAATSSCMAAAASSRVGGREASSAACVFLVCVGGGIIYLENK